MLVEDDAVLVEMYAAKFELEGHDTVVATNGEEALKLLETVTPDIILLDILMPKINGFELCRLIRDQTKDESLIIFIHSGYIAPKHSDQLESSGANAVIWKPAGLTEIREAFLKYGLL